MIFGRKYVNNDLVFTNVNGQAVTILATILVIIHRTKPIFELGQEVDRSNIHMKLGRNWVTNGLVIVSTVEDKQMDGQTDRQVETIYPWWCLKSLT